MARSLYYRHSPPNQTVLMSRDSRGQEAERKLGGMQERRQWLQWTQGPAIIHLLSHRRSAYARVLVWCTTAPSGWERWHMGTKTATFQVGCWGRATRQARLCTTCHKRARGRAGDGWMDGWVGGSMEVTRQGLPLALMIDGLLFIVYS